MVKTVVVCCERRLLLLFLHSRNLLCQRKGRQLHGARAQRCGRTRIGLRQARARGVTCKGESEGGSKPRGSDYNGEFDPGSG